MLQGDKQALAKIGSQKRHDGQLTEKEMKTLFSQQVSRIMKSHLRANEKKIKEAGSRGIAGSIFVDGIAVLGVLAIGVFGYFANKMLKAQ